MGLYRKGAEIAERPSSKKKSGWAKDYRGGLRQIWMQGQAHLTTDRRKKIVEERGEYSGGTTVGNGPWGTALVEAFKSEKWDDSN